MAARDDLNDVPWWEQDAPYAAPTPAPTQNPSAQQDWRWQLTTPPQQARPGYYWAWQGGFNENGQGWQEVPVGGFNNPQNPDVRTAINDLPPSEHMYDLGFWEARGYKAGDIFDLNTGQLKPGWTRTAQGYMFDGRTGPNPPGQNNPPGGPIPTTYGGGGGGFGGFGGGGGSFTGGGFRGWPTYNQPGFEDPGTFDPGPAFSFKDFVSPTAESVTNDPGFQFRMDQGRKALEASRAGRGILNSGETGKALTEYGQNFGSQEYGNVWNRALKEYDTNRNNAFDQWGSQYGQRKDVYGFGADRANNLNSFNTNNAQFDFSGRQQQAEQEFQDLYNRWLAEGNWTKDLALGGLD